MDVDSSWPLAWVSLFNATVQFEGAFTVHDGRSSFRWCPICGQVQQVISHIVWFALWSRLIVLHHPPTSRSNSFTPLKPHNMPRIVAHSSVYIEYSLSIPLFPAIWPNWSTSPLELLLSVRSWSNVKWCSFIMLIMLPEVSECVSQIVKQSLWNKLIDMCCWKQLESAYPQRVPNCVIRIY